jgi:hypothetical protein
MESPLVVNINPPPSMWRISPPIGSPIRISLAVVKLNNNRRVILIIRENIRHCIGEIQINQVQSVNQSKSISQSNPINPVLRIPETKIIRAGKIRAAENQSAFQIYFAGVKNSVFNGVFSYENRSFGNFFNYGGFSR